MAPFLQQFQEKELGFVRVVCVLENAFPSDDMQGSGSAVGPTATAVALHLIVWLKIFPDFSGFVEASTARKLPGFF